MKKLILMTAVAITSITCLTESSYAIALLLPAIQKVQGSLSDMPYTISFTDLPVSSYTVSGHEKAMMVISNQNLWEQGFADTRCRFDCTEFEYVSDGHKETLFVAGTYVEESFERRPRRIVFAGALYLNPNDPNELIFEFRLEDSPRESHTIVFISGWGASSYQYAFDLN